jgi:hypothetical protein
MDVVFILQGHFLTKKMKASYDFVVHITGRSCEYFLGYLEVFSVATSGFYQRNIYFLCVQKMASKETIFMVNVLDIILRIGMVTI